MGSTCSAPYAPWALQVSTPSAGPQKACKLLVEGSGSRSLQFRARILKNGILNAQELVMVVFEATSAHLVDIQIFAVFSKKAGRNSYSQPWSVFPLEELGNHACIL